MFKSTKDRLKEKILNKEKDRLCKSIISTKPDVFEINPYEDLRAPIPDTYCFEYVETRGVFLTEEDMEACYDNTQNRMKYIYLTVEEYTLELIEKGEDFIIKALQNIVFAPHPLWIDSHIDSLKFLREPPNKYFKNKFKDARMIEYMGHAIIIVDEIENPIKAETDFVGLCMIRDEGQCWGRPYDIVVSIAGWKMFMKFLIAIEFYRMMKRNPRMEPYKKYFKKRNLKVNTLIGKVGYPTIKDYDKLKGFTRVVRSWDYY